MVKVGQLGDGLGVRSDDTLSMEIRADLVLRLEL